MAWEDLRWLREATRLPIVLKGICHPDDAKRAIDYGIDAIQCSNHGGSGLGLSIIKAIADRAGMVLNVMSPRALGKTGVEIQVQLPLI